LEEEATFRMEDIIITKSGTNPLISATVTASDKWTLELEDVSEVNANTMRLATIPEGKVHFTGGVTNLLAQLLRLHLLKRRKFMLLMGLT
jgi:hypothetical protein